MDVTRICLSNGFHVHVHLNSEVVASKATASESKQQPFGVTVVVVVSTPCLQNHSILLTLKGFLLADILFEHLYKESIPLKKKRPTQKVGRHSSLTQRMVLILFEQQKHPPGFD